MSRAKPAIVGAAAVVALILGFFIGGTLLSTDSDDTPTLTQATVPAPTTTGTAPAATPPISVPPGFSLFRSQRYGFAIAYPSSWRRIASRRVPLLVARGEAASLLVRVTSVGLDVTPETLPEVRELTDSLVRADRRVELLEEPSQVSLGGVPGFRYLYTFEADTGTRGAHVHYFLFHRGRMITLVFQALPAARLDDQAPIFERIAQTLRPVNP